eukprot:scaffold873_cov393-Prasinococcus_capsulatus_cf.AAC.23
MKAKPPSIPSLSPATAEDQNTHSANYDRMLYHRKPVEEATSLLRSSDHLLSSDDIRVLSGERPTLARTNSGKISPQVSISEEHIQESLSLWAKSEDVKMHGYVYRGSLNVRSICAKRYAVLKEGRLLLFKTAGRAYKEALRLHVVLLGTNTIWNATCRIVAGRNGTEGCIWPLATM